MKKIIQKIMSLSMAIVVLLSTMSFTVNKHYCGGNLVESAIFQKVKGCGMNMDSPQTDSCSIVKKNCCNDEQIVIDGQDNLKISLDKISFEQQIFIAAYIHTYINLFQSIDTQISSFEKYIPPRVIKQIFKLDETYLI